MVKNTHFIYRSFDMTSTVSSVYTDDTLSPDIWLEKSKKRTEKTDPDFIPDHGNGEIRLELSKETHIANDRVFLVYESKFKKLLTKCLECGLVNDEIKEMKADGTHARLKMYFLSGCETSWSTQPELKAVAG